MIWERVIAYRGKLLNHLSLVVKTVSNIQSNLCDILPENISKAEYLSEFKKQNKIMDSVKLPEQTMSDMYS